MCIPANKEKADAMPVRKEMYFKNKQLRTRKECTTEYIEDHYSGLGVPKVRTDNMDSCRTVVRTSASYKHAYVQIKRKVVVMGYNRLFLIIDYKKSTK